MKRLAFLALLALCASAQAQKISQLPTATTPLTGAEILPCDQSGNTKQCTATAIGATAKPAGSSGQLQFNSSGAFGGSLLGYQLGSFNGTDLIMPPQATTGLNINADKWYLDTTAGNFSSSGALYNDPVISLGYNFGSLSTGVGVPDPFSFGMAWESDYGFSSGNAGTTGTSTGGSSSTLTDTGQAWAVNQWAQWEIWDSTKGCSALIASNTATVLTISGVWTATSGTCSSTPASGDSYQILTRQFETYDQVTQWNGATSRFFRPFQITVDKGTAAAQYALGTNGAVTIIAAAAANPPTFTTSVNHGLITGQFVKFAGLAGGTWSNLNGVQFAVTVTGATTFTVPTVAAAGFGTYTASSGTETAEPMENGGYIYIPTVGNPNLVFKLPSWNSSSSDTLFSMLPASANPTFGIYGGSQQNIPISQLLLDPQNSTGVGEITFQANNANWAQIQSNTQGVAYILTTWNAGANGEANFSVYRPNANSFITLSNANPGYVPALLNISSQNQSASLATIAVRPATSQTGDLLDIWDSTGNTTKELFVDSNFLLHPQALESTTIAAPTISGCGTPAATGDWTGHFTAGATTCNPVITFAAAKTANNWWECWLNDETTAITFRQTAHSTTTATLTGSGAATTSDVIDYVCFAH